MAADAAMIRDAQAHPERGILTRVYAWDGPAITLGRSCPAESIDLRGLRAAGIQVARRPTGGAILVHGGDVSFSIAVPDGALALPRDLVAAGRVLASPLLGALRDLGYAAAYRVAEPRRDPPANRPGRAALCFQQRSGLDIMLGNRKVAAFAQRRVRGVLFQHGSVLLEPVPRRVRETLMRAGVGTPREWRQAQRSIRALNAPK